ncbi:MAG: hypothetical protein Q9195_004458 [Heterodermia aff. obscurata]
MSRLKVVHPWSTRQTVSNVTSYQRQYSPSNYWLPSKAQRLHISTHQIAPRTFQPSIWHSIIPNAFRERKWKSLRSKQGEQRAGWNPATFFIFTFLLIGSNAIQMISLRNDFRSFSRKSEAKISLLKEVIERVQNGEDVDVEGLLGTGDQEKEREWEEVIREIEDADANWDPSVTKRKDRQAARMQDGQPSTSHRDEPTAGVDSTESNSQEANASINNSKSTPRGFY